MTITKALLAVLFCAAVALAPTLADARAGGGKSMGSRGYNTYQQTPAKPIDRSMTQKPAAPQAATPGAAVSGGGIGRSPFMTGILGGLLGAGLFGLLFHNPAWAAEGSTGGSMVGMLLQFALIGGALWFGLMLLRRMFGVAPATAGGASPALGSALGGAGAPAAAPQPGPEIAGADQREFGEILGAVQQAWSDGDLGKLRQLATPEMVSYFAEDLADAASRGVRNVVKNVELAKGDVVDSWTEGERQYATAVMTWRSVDYVERDGAAAGGDAGRPTEATEAWTFMRAPGGRWLLSAIQQV